MEICAVILTLCAIPAVAQEKSPNRNRFRNRNGKSNENASVYNVMG
jgi:hypothetical protein